MKYFILAVNPQNGDGFTDHYRVAACRYGREHFHVGDKCIIKLSGKYCRDRKFRLIGIAEIAGITDEKTGYTLSLTNLQHFEPEIRQGDRFIEEFEWEFKPRTSSNWGKFFAQYGINEITERDYRRIVNHTSLMATRGIPSSVDRFVMAYRDLVHDRNLIGKEAVEKMADNIGQSPEIFERIFAAMSKKEKK